MQATIDFIYEVCYNLNITGARPIEREIPVSNLNIGVVGYSGQKFNEEEAKRLLNEGLDAALADNPTATSINLVSGLTDVGIPALAYRIAAERGWETTGVACAKAKEYDCFAVTTQTIVGDNWGDESKTFLAACDVIVRVGGGRQSLAEVAEFAQNGGKVYEFDLVAIPS